MIGIGLSGKNRSGKDEVCKALLRRKEGAYQRFAFADALKLEAARMAGLPDWYFQVEENKIRHRPYLIALGAAGRAFAPLFWVDKTIQDMTTAESCIPVVTDVRYANEARRLQEAGFLLVRLECADEVRFARGGSRDPKVLNDESETGLDGWQDWNLVLRTDMGSSPDVLAAEIADLMEGLVIGQHT